VPIKDNVNIDNELFALEFVELFSAQDSSSVALIKKKRKTEKSALKK